MTFPIAVALCAASLWVDPAHVGQGSLHLKWNDCSGETGGTAFVCAPCFQPGATLSLVGALDLAETAPSVVAMDLIVDWEFPTLPEVPPFWQFHAHAGYEGVTLRSRPTAGRCASSGVDLCGDANCVEYITAYAFGSDIGFPENRGRLLGTIYRGRLDVVSLSPTIQQFGFELEFRFDRDSAGCASAGRVTWKQAVLWGIDPGGKETVVATLGSTPTEPDEMVFLNMIDATTFCTVVPVRLKTWGRLKSLYR